MEERRYLPSKEAEAQRGGKQVRVMQTRSFSEGAIVDMRGDQQKEVPAWAPSLVLDGALLLSPYFFSFFFFLQLYFLP